MWQPKVTSGKGHHSLSVECGLLATGLCACVRTFFFFIRFGKNVKILALRAYFLIKMYTVSQLLPERVARERLHGRQRAEAERRERIFNDKVRTIGVSSRFTPTVIAATNGSNVFKWQVLLFLLYCVSLKIL